MKRLLSLVLALGLSFSLALPSSALDIEDAITLLKTYYIDGMPEGYEETTSLDELLTAINDPYTTYMSPEEYSRFVTSIDGGSVVGIGATIQTIFDNGYQILSILPDSPALTAGLKAGDVIVAVDNVPLTADTDPTAFIRGEEGTQVTLTVRREGHTRPQTITITRKNVPIPIVTYEMADDALVITCDSFGQSTTKDIATALTLHQAQASVCIMDLRSNPGGTSTAAAGAAGMFLGSGIMSYFRDADGEYNHVYTTAACPDLTDKPLIVLTSDYSASGSELFSAAIRDRGAGIGLGQRTFGKGVAQYVFNEDNFPGFFDGDCLKITVYRFFSPDGATNDTLGVIPTLLVPPEHTGTIALLLSSPKPELAAGHLQLKLAGHTFYVNQELACQEENQLALTQLFQALPPSAQISLGVGGAWASTTPEQAAEQLGLEFIPRTFSDVDSSPYKTELNTLACYQILSGFEDGSFKPDAYITRAQFCAMAASALDLPTTQTRAFFSDVDTNAWYAGAVNAMAAKGFISGSGDGCFRPDDAISYQEIVCILNNISGWATMDGYDYNTMELAGQAPVTYGSFSSWAQLSARNLDLFQALLPEVAPTAPATRGQAAATLCRLMEGCGLLWN